MDKKSESNRVSQNQIFIFLYMQGARQPEHIHLFRLTQWNSIYTIIVLILHYCIAENMKSNSGNLYRQWTAAIIDVYKRQTYNIRVCFCYNFVTYNSYNFPSFNLQTPRCYKQFPSLIRRFVRCTIRYAHPHSSVISFRFHAGTET